MPVTRPALCQHFALRRVQCGEQRRSPMASVIVGHALDVAKPHRQHRLRTFERLNLALFIHAQNHCIFWGIQVQPYNIPYFLYEKWIGRELEMFLSVWLYPVSDDRVAHLVRKTLETKPKEGTHWSIRQIAAETRVSKSTLHRDGL